MCRWSSSSICRVTAIVDIVIAIVVIIPVQRLTIQQKYIFLGIIVTMTPIVADCTVDGVVKIVCG